MCTPARCSKPDEVDTWVLNDGSGRQLWRVTAAAQAGRVLIQVRMRSLVDTHTLLLHP